jgi:DNA-binding SARP family transcriptional activator
MDIQKNPILCWPKTQFHYAAYLFGPFRIVRADNALGELTWRRGKAKTLLKWFLLNPRRLISTEQLAKTFWPDTADTTRSLHVTLHYLRHLLEPDLPPRQESTFIHRNKDNYYWFDPHDLWWIDAQEVNTLHESAREMEQRKEYSRAIQYYCRIVEYCDREFLPEDVYGDIFVSYRYQYDCLYSQVLRRLIDLYALQQRFDDVLKYAYLAHMRDLYDEYSVKSIIEAYLHQGYISSAARKFEEFQAFMQEEAELGPELLALRRYWT